MADRIDIIGDSLLRALLDKVAPRVVERVRAGVERVAAEAARDWPVGVRQRGGFQRDPNKPHSRDLFETRIQLERGGRNYKVVGSIINNAKDETGRDYWRFIKAKKLGGGSAIVAFIRKPMQREVERIRADLPQLVPEALRG